MLTIFIQNAALLVSLSVFYGLLKWYRAGNKFQYQLLQGTLFGFIAVAAMLMPYKYDTGMIYDGRSVILALAGFWGGGYSVFFTVIISAAYRVYLGGAGIWAGLATILFCALSGVLFRQMLKNKMAELSFLNFWFIGIGAHLVMLASQLLLPGDPLVVIKAIAAPVMLVFPLTFAIISKLIQLINRFVISEQRIRAAENLYRTTLMSIGDAVICTDKNGLINQMNAVAEELTGWSFPEVKQRPLTQVFKIINEYSRETVESPYTKVIQSGSIVGLANHTLLISKDGKEIPIADSGAPIKSEAGEVNGVVLVFRDQSEERRHQNDLTQSEAKYRDLVESTDSIAWEYDIVQDKWVYVAPQVTEKMGWLPGEWTNLAFWESNVHPDEREASSNYCFACAAKGEPHSLEYRFRKKDGSYIWLRDVVSVEMQNNKAVKMRGVMFDISERKKTEIELKEKNTFIQTVLDHLPIGIALNKIDKGEAFYMNHRFEEIYGWEATELRNIPSFFEKVYPDREYREQITKMIMAGIESGDPEKMHWEGIKVTRSDGSNGFVNAVNIPLPEQNTMVSTVMDVTSRTLAEKELKESEERFRKSILLSPIPIMVHDEDGQVINISEGWTHFSGYHIDEIPSLKAWTEKAYGHKAAEVEDYVKSLYDHKGTELSGEFEIITKQGDKRIWNFYTTPLGKNSKGKKIILSMAPDVTQRIQVKNELAESERAYRQLFENHTAVKLLIDPDNGNILMANKAAENYYGWSVEQLQTMNINQINTLSDKEINKALEHARANHRVYFEFKHRLANGQIRDVEVFVSKIDQKGKDLLHSIVHDVTDKKKLLKDLIVAKEKAEESDRLKTAFLANMSHEIRTPINAIMGFSSLLPDEYERKNISQYSDIIVKNSEYLVRLIDDVMLYSRLQTNLLKNIPEKFEIGTLLSDLMHLFKMKENETGIDLNTKMPDNQHLLIKTDYDKLKQLLANLISNAFKYTIKGSITLGVEKDESRLLFYVKDTGIGIPEDEKEKVFDRFYRARNAQSGKSGGTGLGLSIVKELAALLGGNIWFDSKTGEGTTFYYSMETKDLPV